MSRGAPQYRARPRGLFALGLLLCVPFAGACFQDLNEGASSAATKKAGSGPTISLETPPIDLPNGGTTTDPCALTTLQATEILKTNCAGCHGGGSPGARQGQPPFDFVLNFDKLKTAQSASVPDPVNPSTGMHFVYPGEPYRSRIYMRISHNEMPPTLPLGLDPLPRPSVSDISLLYSWISSCLGASPSPPAPPAPMIDAGVVYGNPDADDHGGGGNGGDGGSGGSGGNSGPGGSGNDGGTHL